MADSNLQVEPITQRETPRDLFEGFNYIVKELGSGFYATVYLSIPRDPANTIIAEYGSGTPSAKRKARARSQLQNAAEAIKIHKGRDRPENTDALSKEIRILRYLKACGHRNIVSILEVDEEVKWYTMPVYPGGSLEQLVKELWKPDPPKLPVALAWHIALGLTTALLFLHFGVDAEGTKQKNWPLLAHNDVHWGNFLFHMPSGEERHGNYPDIALIDFGKVGCFREEDDGSTVAERAVLLQNQIKDIQNLVMYLQYLANRIDDAGFAQAIERLGEIEHAEKGDDKNRPMRTKLMQFVSLARRSRDELYRDLSAGLEAYFKKPIVSDEELENVFEALRSSQPELDEESGAATSGGSK